jgi:hypothetical protein
VIGKFDRRNHSVMFFFRPLLLGNWHFLDGKVLYTLKNLASIVHYVNRCGFSPGVSNYV